ncbi:hypothetical protein EU528_09870 [Candidatus Thorarchaeota archaeon]|nr:MAG: hypothetical protein EU528_09870 [Candidatus Thorarchaeota archaeon]
MMSSNHTRFIFAFMLALIILSPCVTSVGNTNFSITPTSMMAPAAPTITGPTLFEFENGTVGDTIEYDAYDPNPKNWSVTVDGSDYTTNTWDGGPVTVLLIYLITRNLIVTVPQDFTFVITVYNQAEENASITTTVRAIQDTSAPNITQPANITYEEGHFGNVIRWNITEANPNFYNISRVSNEAGTNSSVMETGEWNGDDIEINVDGLNASHWYIYTLFVNDTLGMNSTSSVNVTVLPDITNPAISSPDDIEFEFGDEGFEIRWEAYDSNPKNYTIEVYIHFNDTIYGAGQTDRIFHSPLNFSQPDWTFADPDGGDISISLDGIFLGNYTFNITAFDTYNQSTSDSVYLRIYPDIRAPVIDAADDLVYEEGYTGYNITWDIDENNPLWYNLTFDGTVIMNGTWDGENFSINVDGLDVGVHDYNMTLSDFFGAISFAIIQVEVTPDAHNPIVAHIPVIQTLTTQTTNNLTVQAYVWDLNNIQDITIEWGVGNPEDTTFEPDAAAMTLSEPRDFFTTNLGEYSHGVVVWYRISATDNSSVLNVERTTWLNVTVTSMNYEGVPALLYGVVGVLGGLSLLVFVVMYFRTRK